MAKTQSCSLIPRDDMEIVVGQMSDEDVLTTFCDFIDKTQTEAEKRSEATLFDNKVGVSSVHAKRCTELMHRAKKGGKIWGSDIHYARKMLIHYRQQLVERELV